MNKNRKGFVLIELLIVALIIGVLACIALPKFHRLIKLQDCKTGHADACRWLASKHIQPLPQNIAESLPPSNGVVVVNDHQIVYGGSVWNKVP